MSGLFTYAEIAKEAPMFEDRQEAAQLRLECLRLAVSTDALDALALARDFYAWVSGNAVPTADDAGAGDA